MTALLTLHELSKRRYDAPDRYLFQGVSADLAQGQRTALIGISGQGKSTLLRIMARLDTADGGDILYRGTSFSRWKPNDWRKQVCYVAQQPVMLPGSVEDNLQTVSRLNGTPFDRELAGRCMEALGLASTYWAKPASELSGGEKQRVALVRSLLLRPAVLLLDEVTASLDPGSKKAVEQLLNDWSQREGTANLWITHDLEQVKQASDRVWFMAEGRLLEQEDTQAFFACPRTDEARRFIAWQETESPENGKEEVPNV
ncbi:ATP-binding cassette domain-containing protein [Paenibacillus allorhizosphaerae]|uniref:Vitamin B12 import ATP-binding protein BtuD n=1 Tax=Paenibacillus allorhizosphaerae TaxID=2849866 RepID=A0ABM8VDY1_9BACL|nr:ATP-binding cassette domain-containing protein [Paenibacillus allorhizosphaerae]CAG7627266.1 Vitamin B12 import ATP-binding protein BtuD [Paenibacillus allorhizosphaerae]